MVPDWDKLPRQDLTHIRARHPALPILEEDCPFILGSFAMNLEKLFCVSGWVRDHWTTDQQVCVTWPAKGSIYPHYVTSLAIGQSQTRENEQKRWPPRGPMKYYTFLVVLACPPTSSAFTQRQLPTHNISKGNSCYMVWVTESEGCFCHCSKAKYCVYVM